MQTQYHPTQASQVAPPKWQIDKKHIGDRHSLMTTTDIVLMSLPTPTRRCHTFYPRISRTPPVYIHCVENYGKMIRNITKTVEYEQF